MSFGGCGGLDGRRRVRITERPGAQSRACNGPGESRHRLDGGNSAVGRCCSRRPFVWPGARCGVLGAGLPGAGELEVKLRCGEPGFTSDPYQTGFQRRTTLSGSPARHRRCQRGRRAPLHPSPCCCRDTGLLRCAGSCRFVQTVVDVYRSEVIVEATPLGAAAALPLWSQGAAPSSAQNGRQAKQRPQGRLWCMSEL